MTPDQAYSELIQRSRDVAMLGSCGAVVGWDERTYMPRAAAGHRGNQMALLARLVHEMVTAPRIGELLSALEGTSLVADPASDAGANVREIRRSYDRAVKLPRDLVEELARVTTEAQGAWQEARENNDYSRFQPWLERIVALKRREADAVGFKSNPYDALLDEFEPGATAAEITKLFAELRRDLVALVATIANSKKTPRLEILQREYAIDRQQFFGQSAAIALGFDFDAGRLDVTTHPFCTGIGPGDTRILTRYNPRFFSEAFFGILHETGHGLYEQNLPREHFGTPCGLACSFGIHESQSRLWENQVGRGRPFWEHFFPRLKQTFPAPLRDVALDDWYFAINDVQPSFIRVEADEATYNLHIILRFEIEQGLLTGDLKPADLPGAWNEQFQKMLGITPPTDAQGCLQDIHWSFGGIGYFPTYTLGNLYAAQFMAQAQHDLPALADDFRRGEFGRLKCWLNDSVYRHGQRYRPNELCRRVTGGMLDHLPFVAYLREKFEPLYAV
jgi:carboxypeptidase Taq